MISRSSSAGVSSSCSSSSLSSAASSACVMISMRKSFLLNLPGLCCFSFSYLSLNLMNSSSDTCTANVLAAIFSTPLLSKCSVITAVKNCGIVISVPSNSCRTFSCSSMGIFPHMFLVSMLYVSFPFVTYNISQSPCESYSSDATNTSPANAALFMTWKSSSFSRHHPFQIICYR